MNPETSVTTLTATTPAIDVLNSLLRGELAAVATYEHAMISLESAPQTEAELLVRLSKEHRRSVATLQSILQSLGAKPSEGAGPWGFVTRLAGKGAILLGDRTTVALLEEGEEHGLHEYQKAIGAVDLPDVRRTIEIELIPRQRKHVAALRGLKLDLAGPSEAPRID